MARVLSLFLILSITAIADGVNVAPFQVGVSLVRKGQQTQVHTIQQEPELRYFRVSILTQYRELPPEEKREAGAGDVQANERPTPQPRKRVSEQSRHSTADMISPGGAIGKEPQLITVMRSAVMKRFLANFKSQLATDGVSNDLEQRGRIELKLDTESGAVLLVPSNDPNKTPVQRVMDVSGSRIGIIAENLASLRQMFGNEIRIMVELE